jgi:hypothetical protein
MQLYNIFHETASKCELEESFHSAVSGSSSEGPGRDQSGNAGSKMRGS